MASTQQNLPASLTPADTRIYAIGDIHGRADLLLTLHGLIVADAAGASVTRKILIYLGDYVDRGSQSFAVVDMLASSPLTGFEAVYLKGNHEDMLLSFLLEGKLATTWLLNGGTDTLSSYEIYFDGSPRDKDALQAVQREFRKALPQSHLKFFQSLALYHVEGDYFFAHAGVDPLVPLNAQKPADLLWIRKKFLNHTAPFEKVVVHGHTITPSPCIRANRIGIDTGACQNHCLTCLVLEGEERRFLQT